MCKYAADQVCYPDQLYENGDVEKCYRRCSDQIAQLPEICVFGEAKQKCGGFFYDGACQTSAMKSCTDDRVLELEQSCVYQLSKICFK